MHNKQRTNRKRNENDYIAPFVAHMNWQSNNYRDNNNKTSATKEAGETVSIATHSAVVSVYSTI